jgi:hypothetical protein
VEAEIRAAVEALHISEQSERRHPNKRQANTNTARRAPGNAHRHTPSSASRSYPPAGGGNRAFRPGSASSSRSLDRPTAASPRDFLRKGDGASSPSSLARAKNVRRWI